jgi:erythronate-4-phosphate dehydrogenase
MKIVADENIPYVQQCFSSIGDVRALSGREMGREAVAEADVLLVRSITRVNADLLAGSRVRFVGTATIGVDHIDVDFLKGSNIGFASAPGSNANSAAEYVIAALLEIAHDHQIQWQGASIGIIGVGNVGSRVAKKCTALGMKTRLNDPPLQRQTGNQKYLGVEELFDCDFITLHTPLTFQGPDKTFHLADHRFFQSLKPGCVFVNASRGAVVDSNALKAAIRAKKLKAVVLDVWENEPKIDIELLEMVDIGTPHIAGYSLDGKVGGMIMIYKAACKYFGLEPEFEIGDFLPEPDAAELQLDIQGDSQNKLRAIVRKVYDIRADDRKLRQVDNRPAEKRGAYFDGLRKNYPVRREFHNTRVIVNDIHTEFANTLSGIGFLLSQE